MGYKPGQSNKDQALPPSDLSASTGGRAQLPISDESSPGSTFRKQRLRILIQTLLLRAAREIHPKRRFAFLEEARDLSKRLRDGGFTDWFAIGCAAVTVIMALGLIWAKWPKVYFYSYPNDYLRVVQNINLETGDFVMQRVLDGVPQPETEMHFRGLLPRFEAGHTLAWIRYRDGGSYQSIEGFDVVREDKVSLVNGSMQRLPKFAPNCIPNWAINHLVCEGGKARFQ